MAVRLPWSRGDYFLIHDARYLPRYGRVRVWYENFDVGEAPVHALWADRAGRPDWQRLQVDPETRGALLVPIKGQNGSTRNRVEIPSDVVRAATDVDYRAFLARQAADWARRVGRELVKMRVRRGWTKDKLARRTRVDKGLIDAVENGRVEPSLTFITRLIESMGMNVPDWLSSAKH